VLWLAGALWGEPASAGQAIGYESGYPPGAILISQTARTLYLIVDAHDAIAYPVAVAKRGKEWHGFARVQAKFVEVAARFGQTGSSRIAGCDPRRFAAQPDGRARDPPRP
jgi:hypothetical protein